MAKIKELYENAKSAKVGSTCKCPSCGTEFVKTNYQQAFCKSKNGTICKDKYWNTVTPEKRNNTTRISPANASWMAMKETQRSSRVRRTSEGYIVRNGVAYDEFGEPVYNVDINEDAYEHGQWND
jgi:hypothetical protein